MITLFKKKSTTNFQQGQTFLIVILIMVVSLTVGLAVVSRSITNLRTTTEEENSQRAFSAAEAGVERALKLKLSQTGSVIADESLASDPNLKIKQVKVTQIGGSGVNQILLNGGEIIQKDDGADIWLVEHNGLNESPNYSSPWTGQFLTFYWGTTTDCNSNPAALEIILVGGTTINTRSNRYAVDQCASNRNNHFDPPTASGSYVINGKTFTFKYTISIPNLTNPLITRVIPLYSSTSISVTGCDTIGSNCTDIPSQGRIIDSTGLAGTTERKVTFFQGYPKLPSELFQYGLFWTIPATP